MRRFTFSGRPFDGTVLAVDPRSDALNECLHEKPSGL